MYGDALVLSAGGFWAAWQAGAWSVLRERFRPGLIVGASAGAWNGWAIAGGASPEELARDWLDPRMAGVIRFGLHRAGFLRGEPLMEAARELFARYRPVTPFALTMVEVPSLRLCVVRESDVTWQHLAAACAIPLGFPPVEIGGRRYVDGGLRGALPLWVADKLGARRAVALNVLNTPGFRLLHRAMRTPPGDLEARVIEPSRRLGALRGALVWNVTNVARWIELGRCDASSITM